MYLLSCCLSEVKEVCMREEFFEFMDSGKPGGGSMDRM